MSAQEANPARSMLGGAMFLALTAAPMVALICLAAWDRNADGPAGVVRALSGGLITAGAEPVAIVAWTTGIAFSAWLVVTEHLRANRAPQSHARRWRRRLVDAIHTLLIVGGGALLIYGGLALLYCLLTAIRPDLVSEPRLPFSFWTSIPSLGFGGAMYALGRLSW